MFSKSYPEVSAAIITGIFAAVSFIVGQLLSIYRESRRFKIDYLHTLLSNDIISRNLRFFWNQAVSLKLYYRLFPLDEGFSQNKIDEKSRAEIESLLRYLRARLGYRTKIQTPEKIVYSATNLKDYEVDVLKTLKEEDVESIIKKISSQKDFLNKIKQCFEDTHRYFYTRDSEAWFVMFFGVKPSIRKRLVQLIKLSYERRNEQILWDELELLIRRFVVGKWKLPLRSRIRSMASINRHSTTSLPPPASISQSPEASPSGASRSHS